jgi:hypothetical protein
MVIRRAGLPAVAALWMSAVQAGAVDEWNAGVGVTYQFDPTKSGYVAFAAWTPRRDRYELAAIRFATTQRRSTESVAEPNWVFQASRRWNWTPRPHLTTFVGFGLAYKSKTDDLNGSRLNFAEQLGCRFRIAADAPVLEVALRHISNGGFKRPNRGQDFVTVALVF